MFPQQKEPLINLRAIKTAARNEFGSVPGVQGFGIGDGTLRVYVSDPSVRHLLPAAYQGAPVEFVVTGDISAYSASAAQRI